VYDTMPPVHDPYYEPFYAACEDLDLTLSVHAGWGSPQGKFQEFVRTFLANVVGVDQTDEFFAKNNAADMMMEAMASSADSPLVLDMGPRRVFWQLMLGGVFDRHPNLKLALTEVRADWVPATLAALDARFEQGDLPSKRRPSEYWTEHCFATPSSPHRCEIDMRHEIGIDNFLFGTDYPHPEGTWPNTKEWIRVAFAGVPRDEVEKMLSGNAIRAYSLDAATVDAVAAKIGPTEAEIFGSPDVDPYLLAHFDTRAGYARGPEQVDTDLIRGLVDDDLASIA
jgi:predicted TIM-barrel fold metal-dependent hydrolase